MLSNDQEIILKKSVTLPREHPGTFRMKGQTLHSSRLRLKFRQHLILANCSKRDVIN